MKHYNLIFVLLMFFCSSCIYTEDENHHYTINMFNNSDRPIYTVGYVYYPDKKSVLVIPSSSEPSIFKVGPYQKNDNALWLNAAYEDTFGNKMILPSDTFMICVFDAELVERSTTHVVDSFIQSYYVSLRDLQNCNWTITYPPTDAMKNVKMYPPYSNYIKK